MHVREVVQFKAEIANYGMLFLRSTGVLSRCARLKCGRAGYGVHLWQRLFQYHTGGLPQHTSLTYGWAEDGVHTGWRPFFPYTTGALQRVYASLHEQDMEFWNEDVIGS